MQCWSDDTGCSHWLVKGLIQTIKAIIQEQGQACRLLNYNFIERIKGEENIKDLNEKLILLILYIQMDITKNTLLISKTF